MTRREFTDRVLLPLTRLTWDEREAVRRELEEHIEDRMEVLLEMGWAGELAEARCLEAMGDPAEIGRELAAQYRGRGRRWLWLGRAAVALTAVLCVQATANVGILSFLWDSLNVRCGGDLVPEVWTTLDEREAAATVDIRVPVGNDVLRVARVSVGRAEGNDILRAELVLVSYDRLPGGIVSTNVINGLELEDQRGAACEIPGGVSGGNYMMWSAVRYAEVEPGDAYVTLVYHQFGETGRVQVPLPKEGET